MSNQPIRLSDSQLATIMILAQPLQPRCRTIFLQLLTNEPRGRHDIGDGELTGAADPAPLDDGRSPPRLRPPRSRIWRGMVRNSAS
jgi:hypothetical protein